MSEEAETEDDTILKVEEEFKECYVTSRGHKLPLGLKIISTTWSSGRKDCTVVVPRLNLKPTVKEI